jgi:ATP-binding cassette subfamily F protein uup
MLEERLVEFAGTVLVVSHDRSFLDNVVTSTLVFEPAGPGNGKRQGAGQEQGQGQGAAYVVREYVGGYGDWLRQRPAPAAAPPAPSRPQPAPASAAPAADAPRKKRSFKEQRELESLPAEIETLETEIAALHAALAAPDYYRQPAAVLAGDQARLRDLEARLTTAFARWEALEAGAG